MADPEVKATISAENKAGPALSGFTKGLIGVTAAVAAAVAAIKGLAGIVGNLIETSKAQQVADVQLAASLRTVGQNTRETREDLEQFASALQDLTTTDDRVVKSVAGVLASLGQLSGEELKRATVATLDFAAVLGQDANSAALLVAKAAGGMTSVLSRYGIQIDKNTKESDKFAAVLDKLEQKAGGVAAAVGQTFAGKVARLNNNLNDAAELLGDIITKSEAFNRILDIGAEIAGGFSEEIKNNEDAALRLSNAIAEFVVIGIRGAITMTDMALAAAQMIAKIQDLGGAARKTGAVMKFLFDATPVGLVIKQIKLLDQVMDEYGLTTSDAGEKQNEFVLRLQAVRDRLGLADEQFKQLLEDIRAGKTGFTDVADNLGNSLAPTLQGISEDVAEFERVLTSLGQTGFDTLGQKATDFETRVGQLRNDLIQGIITPEFYNQQIDGLREIQAALEKVGITVTDLGTKQQTTSELFKSVGIIPFEKMQEKADAVNAAFATLREQFEQGDVTSEYFIQQAAQLDAMAQSLEEAGFNMETFFATVEGGAETTQGKFDDMTQAISGPAKNAASQFGDAIVGAMLDGKQSFGEMIVSIIKGLAAAIIKALLLKAIMGAFTGGAGFFVSGGGVATGATGGRVRGVRRGTDSVPALLTPGEIVLPASLASGFAAVAKLAEQMTASGGQASPVGGVNLALNVASGTSDETVRDLIEAINEAVERKGMRLVSTEALAVAT